LFMFVKIYFAEKIFDVDGICLVLLHYLFFITFT
jgi:hypothetical protein